MSRKRRPPAKPRLRPKRRRPVLAWVVAAASIAALAWWGLSRSRRQDAVASMPPDQAESVGAQYLQNRHLEASVPFLRRGLQGSGGRQSQPHLLLALALYGVTMATQNRAGIEQPLARSSLERIAIANESEREFTIAASLATSPAERAAVEAAHAEFEFAWGRIYEAFALMRRAQFDDPGNQALATRADQFQLMLEHPELFATTEEVMRREATRNR